MKLRNSKIKPGSGGFSLMEMLIATGIMAVGLVLIATIFPVAIKLTGFSAERSVAAVAADEAFAKVRLYGVRDFAIAGINNWPVLDPNITCTDYQYVTDYAGPDGKPDTIDDNYLRPGIDGIWGNADDIYWDSEFLYPSAALPAQEELKYHWSALCRRAGGKEVQVTVFVTRRNAAGMNYRGYFYDGTSYAVAQTGIWPSPVPVNVQFTYNAVVSPLRRELRINTTDPVNNKWQVLQLNLLFSFLEEGYTIVNGRDGKIYRIMETEDRDTNGTKETIVLYEDWQWAGYPAVPAVTTATETVWVVPPGVGSDRCPCVGVFQKVMRFDEIN